MERLETERLSLRPFVPDDAEAIWKVVYSDPAVCEHFCGLTWTLGEVEQWVAFHRYDTRWGDLGYLAVMRKSDRQMLGLVGLRPYVAAWIKFKDDPVSPYSSLEMELTYAFGQAFWGQGYASEACSAVVMYAFRYLKLARLAYAVNVNNVGSWRLMKRLGFRFERNLRPEGWDDVVGVMYNNQLDGDGELLDAASDDAAEVVE